MNGRYSQFDLDQIAAYGASQAAANAAQSSSGGAAGSSVGRNAYQRTGDFDSFGLLDQSPAGSSYNPNTLRAGHGSVGNSASHSTLMPLMMQVANGGGLSALHNAGGSNGNIGRYGINDGSMNSVNAMNALRRIHGSPGGNRSRNISGDSNSSNSNSNNRNSSSNSSNNLGGSSAANTYEAAMNAAINVGLSRSAGSSRSHMANSMANTFGSMSYSPTLAGVNLGLDGQELFATHSNKRSRTDKHDSLRQHSQQQTSMNMPISTYAASLLSSQAALTNGNPMNMNVGLNDGSNADMNSNSHSRSQQSQNSQTSRGRNGASNQYRPDAQTSNQLQADAMLSSSSASYRSSTGTQDHSHDKNQKQRNQKPFVDPDKEEWLASMKIDVPGLSLEPMTGTEVVQRLRTKTEEVLTRYLPCVDFLVACQQELRKGLAAATQKRVVHRMLRDSMTPRQFFQNYIAPLPDRFYRKNKRLMTPANLDTAVKEIQKLVAEAKAVERQGCETMKNTFLGGMKDGESWGLRKWLSKNGGALHICNDCECILHACQKLDRSNSSTSKLASRLRPLAKQSLSRLKGDVPSSYQEVSTAHPYLPFFHRLESALRGLSTFDPDDDDVICIDDDDEIDEIKAAAPPSKPATTSKKRSRSTAASSSSSSSQSQSPSQNREKKRKASAPAAAAAVAASKNGESDEDSIVEILEVKPSSRDGDGTRSPFVGGEFLNFFAPIDDVLAGTTDPFEVQDGSSTDFPELDDGSLPGAVSGLERRVNSLIKTLLAGNGRTIRPSSIDTSAFWNSTKMYTAALRIFVELLKMPGADTYVVPVDELVYPTYRDVIKHPLCFGDIVDALMTLDEKNGKVVGRNGQLTASPMKKWNMWNGSDLLQAIDLVLLNSLAYGKHVSDSKSVRSQANKFRRHMWTAIKDHLTKQGIVDEQQRRSRTPTRRGESSGFVLKKK